MTAPALPAKPLLFISHKHADHEIAKALADFIKNRTGAQVRIHVSSHPDYSGPSSGRFLNEQLRTTLWQTEALILIYTSADQNWSYCLWECGVATNEHHPNRNIIILQCGEEVPAVYEGCLTTKANDFQSVRKLVGEIFMGPDFFAGRGRPVTDFTEKDCDDAAKDLHQIFVGLLSTLQRPESWSPWPLLRVELPGDDVRALVSIRDRAVANSLVSEKATIVGCNSELPRLFGKTRIETDIPLSALLPNSGLDPEWFESCCDQIADFVASREPVVHLVSIGSPSGDSYTPVVTGLKRNYGKSRTEFEISFVDLSDPRGIPVTAKMVSIDRMFFRELEEVRSQLLEQVIDDLDRVKMHRLPLLSNGLVEFIVHRSVIDRFLLQRLRARPPLPDATLDDLLHDAKLGRVFQAFCLVGRRATIAEARSKAAAIPDCRDVFVTETGKPTEPVIGYLTNVDLAGPSHEM